MRDLTRSPRLHQGAEIAPKLSIVRGMDRRDFLAGMAAAPLAAASLSLASPASAAQAPVPAPAQAAAKPRVPIKQSVMASVWTGTKYSFEERCQILQKFGFKGMDLPSIGRAHV